MIDDRFSGAASQGVDRAVWDALESSPDAFFLMRAVRERGRVVDFEFIRLNRRAEERLGMPRAALLGKRANVLFPESLSHGFFDVYQRVMETGESLERDYRGRDGRETSAWFRQQVMPVRDGVAICDRDITADRRRQAELNSLTAEREQRWRMLDDILSATSDRFLMYDVDGRYLYASPAAFRDIPLDPAQIYGKTWRELGFPVRMGVRFEAALKQVIETGQPTTYELTVRPEGAPRTYESILSPTFDASGNVTGAVNSIREITERKRLEQELRDTASALAAAQRIARLGSWTRDLETGTTTWSDEYYRLLGYELGGVEASPETFWQHIHPDDVPAILARGDAARQRDGIVESVEYRLVGHDGVERIVLSDLAVERDAAGNTVRLVGTIQDVTESKRAREALRESEEKYRMFFSQEQDGVFLADFATGEVLEANAAGAAMYGYSVEELAGMTWLELTTDPKKAREAARRVDAMGASPRSAGFRWHRRKDGTLFPIEATAATFTLRGRRLLSTIVRDVSARVGAETALRESEANLEEAQRLAHVGNWTWDPATGEMRWSDEAARIFGYDPEAETPAPQEVNDRTHPDDRERVDADFAEARRTKHEFEVEYRAIRRDGRTAWLHSKITPRLDAAGEVRAWFGTLLDVTDAHRAQEERRRFEAQVQHAQKLESLGVLAGGIAHDFNNLLMGVLGNASLALLDLPESSPVREMITDIQTAAQRAADLTRQMLAYSGKGRFVVQPLDITAIVNEMLHLLSTVITKNATVQYDLGDGLPAIAADATQLRQVVMNLITNASDALDEEPGLLTIRTGVMHADRAYLRETYLAAEDPAPGKYIFFEVSDSGCGMDPETRAKIFDPFFTTKFAGRGLGLAAVLGIVRGHHGAIRIDSDRGQGTTFRVLFPVTKVEHPHAAPVDGGVRGSAPWRGSGTVLIVDDEEPVRSITSRILERAGFSTLAAADGLEAIEVFRARREQIVLVLLDLTMPRLDGAATYRALREIDAGVRVLVSSGYGEQDVTSRFAGEGVAGFIQKPYGQEELIARARDVLSI